MKEEFDKINKMTYGGFVMVKDRRLPYFVNNDIKIIVGEQQDWAKIEEVINNPEFKDYKYLILH